MDDTECETLWLTLRTREAEILEELARLPHATHPEQNSNAYENALRYEMSTLRSRMTALGMSETIRRELAELRASRS